MGNFISTARAEHTCGRTAQSQNIRPLLCQRCDENACLRFKIEAAIRTQVCLFPEKYKLETHGLTANSNWIDIALGRSTDSDSLKKQEKVLRDLVRVYCLKDTLPRDRPKCVCRRKSIEMKEFQKILATRLDDKEPKVHLTFERVRTPVPKILVAEAIPVVKDAPAESVFIIGDDDDKDDASNNAGKADTSKGKERAHDDPKLKRKSAGKLEKQAKDKVEENPVAKSAEKPVEKPKKKTAAKPEANPEKKLAKKSRFIEGDMS